MWLFTPIGFFSIVRKPSDTLLTVRARAAGDLEQLRDTYLPELSPTRTHAGTDYPYRAQVSSGALGLGLMAIADDLTYANFKNEVAARQGHPRAHVYGQVWQDLLSLEQLAPQSERTPSSSLRPAYGGVVINDAGQVLLVAPKNHFDGYAWTFPKGRPEPNETPEETAVREVREEARVIGSITCPISGAYRGGTTLSRYFLMRITASLEESNATETQSTMWASYEDARDLIGQTSNKLGRQRDRTVLNNALRTWTQQRIAKA